MQQCHRFGRFNLLNLSTKLIALPTPFEVEFIYHPLIMLLLQSVSLLIFAFGPIEPSTNTFAVTVKVAPFTLRPENVEVN